MKDIQNFLKDKKNIIILVLECLLSFIFTLVIINHRLSLGDIKTFNIWLFLLIMIGFSYIISHFLFKIKDVYDFIYEKRFIIAGVIFLIVVLGKFNGSSIGIWNVYVEPSESHQSENILGIYRGIRSDEWLVNTPFVFSQKYNNYKYFSDLPRAEKTDMFTGVFTPIWDIIILGRPFNLGYLFLGEDYGLSIYWYGRLIALLLVSFEFCMLITNKKKLPSIVGAFLITGAPAVQWFYSNYLVDLLISGQLCLLIFNNYLSVKEKKKKLLYSVLIAFAFNWFVLTLYPAWQVPLGYMYLVFAVWLLVKNWKNNKNIKDYSYLGITILLVGFMVGRYLTLGMDTIMMVSNTVYPGARSVLGGGSTVFNFIYPISIFFPISDYLNPSEASGVYSLFPIPIIVSIYYLIKYRTTKDKNHEKLLLCLLTILVLIFTLFTMKAFPEIVTKLTLLKMVPSKRVVPIIGLICCYLLIMLMGKIKITKKSIKILLFVITIFVSVGIVYIGRLNKVDYGTMKKVIGSSIILIAAMYLFLISSNKKAFMAFSILMILLGFENMAIINPVRIGTDVLHEKSSAKKIQSITKTDSALWLAVDSITLGNYVLANGGRAVNSTNIYPNLKRWRKIDPNKEYEDVYNRYAHINVLLTEEETSFELLQSDTFQLHLNYNDLETLDIGYLISDEEIPLIDNYNYDIIYQNENIWMYKYNGKE